MSGLQLALDDRDRGVRVDLALPSGTTTALVGPNGAGKTTVLTSIAGIHRTDARVRLDGRDLTHLPAHRRRMPLLSQDPLLLPHLTALDNVALGPQAQGRTRRDARAAARDWLQRVGAGHLSDRRPHQLSGGEARRVALARALAAEPDVMLLDEPLAALDQDAAPELRHVLRESLAGVTTVLVTHDVLDVALLADTAVVLGDGKVVEQAPVADLLSSPRTPFAARLAGTNLVRGTLSTAQTLTARGGLVMSGVSTPDCAVGDEVVATFRPEAVAVHAEDPGGSPRNRLVADVIGIEPSGGSVLLRARSAAGVLTADLTPAAVAELGLSVGDRTYLVVKATAVTIQRV